MPTPEDALPGRAERMAVPSSHFVLGTPLEPPFPEGLERAMFGMGCFWGAERELLAGRRRVHDRRRLRRRLSRRTRPTRRCARAGPATTRSCSSCSTPTVTRYDELLRVFWENHDPTQGMRQGNDVGTQYRSGIYTFADAQREAAEASRDAYQEQLTRRRLRRDHDRDRAGADVLLRRGLPPAVPGEEPGRLLRPRRHRRVLPRRRRRRLTPGRTGAQPAASRWPIRRTRVVRVVGPAVGIGVPPLPLVVLGVRHGLAVVAHGGHSHHHRHAGRQRPPAPRCSGGSARAATPRAAPAAASRPDSRPGPPRRPRPAPSARPRWTPTPRGGRRSQRPSSVRTTHRAVRLAEASLHQAQRPARGLQLQGQAVPRARRTRPGGWPCPSCAGELAVAEGAHRLVGLPGRPPSAARRPSRAS